MLAEYRPMLRRIARVAYRRCVPFADMVWNTQQDADQEADTAAVQAWRDFDPTFGLDVRAFVAWRTTRRMVDGLRHAMVGARNPANFDARRVRPLSVDLEPEAAMLADRASEDAYDRATDRLALVQEIRKLPPQARRVFQYRLAGLSLHQCARRLKVSDQRVSAILGEFTPRLRRILNPGM